MNDETAYEATIVLYFAQVLSDKSGLSLDRATDAVSGSILEVLRTAEARGLHRIDLPMGDIMLGRKDPPNEYVAAYVASVRAKEEPRWAVEGVTEKDVADWWNLGAVIHAAYVAFDDLFIRMQLPGFMEGPAGSGVEEHVSRARWSLRKHIALYGTDPDDFDLPAEDRRLPPELRARIEAWTIRAKRENVSKLSQEIERHSSYNALCRHLIQEGRL